MSQRRRAEEHPLFEQLRTALTEVAEQASAREAAVQEQGIGQAERWAGWQSRWLEESRRLTAALDSIRESKRRSDEQVAEADAELAKVESSLASWTEASGVASAPRV
jgi:uncharacterized protein YukE